jgi:hypothetical protein
VLSQWNSSFPGKEHLSVYKYCVLVFIVVEFGSFLLQFWDRYAALIFPSIHYANGAKRFGQNDGK